MPTPLEIANKMVGRHERANNAEIRQYLEKGGAGLNPAKTAWCAAFVNATLAQAGAKGSGSNLARSLLNVGEPTKTPKQGDIAVFSRGDPKGPYGHVGFFTGRYDENGNPIVLGGNQSDSVREAPYDKAKLLGYRAIDKLLGTQLAGPPASAMPVGGAAWTPSTATAAWPGEGQSVAPITDPRGIPGTTLDSNPIPRWQDTSMMQPTPPPTQAPAESPTGSQFAEKLMGADGMGGKDTPFGKSMAGMEDLLGGLNPKQSTEAKKEAQTLEPSHSNLVANSSENTISQMAPQLMQSLLQNKRRNYGMTLTG